MINSKEERDFYIKQDCIRNTGEECVGMIKMLLHCWYGNDTYRAFRYLRSLRNYEYALNCTNGLRGKMQRILAKVRWHRLGAKYNVNVPPNVVGYGFRIPHLVGGVIINCKSMGNNCTANTGVVVGNNNKGGMAIIGNNVDLSIGCKVIGGVTIGDNVIVAPNSVVVKNVPANAIVTGIPAVILKYQTTYNSNQNSNNE